ncbi:MAG: phosphoenolpyruvate---glycerone phosphotransferase subunit DhaM [Eubacteriaceae bacterium]|jgi:dihydroxyacetone kinase phosphotransfer subunit|nr:phosphoenolpyruvate---glycerone phosphotransferase subunit DhaM [Eubacteriaceae bacterium]MDK2905105.1 phosphoenolpyruvate---glycerone phosphotransferase subunit DhaM [Eubacteriaceae bacterium]MDK2935445.1 phosphoenolpyruvate---glycerone phosphotransferase subunit DhaM [Eubacteriaceae bacterium]MDK2961002.1 phosphoenolpyruvate---glycerone phosphotransferase subunit DhaM [Eubacteriaceae bacterium]MDN5306897.1 phosphoenolpyruvate---glycerone phosphotransferase subunit DhaM [Eubacteriaceae bact
MTGVIIVSHSEKLAEGLRDIVMEMNDGSVEIIAAGGTGDGRVGTNTNRIKNAIETLQDKDQILIFVDLGSAVICSETAIEMLDDEGLQDKVHIVDAPLVEGVVGGVVQATICDDLDLIVATAKEGATIQKVS